MSNGPGIEHATPPAADEFNVAERRVLELRALAAATRALIDNRTETDAPDSAEAEDALSEVLAAMRAAEQLRDRLKDDRARFRTR